MKKRLIVAEKYIMRDAANAYAYAENIIQGRWPEAEEFILQELDIACKYAKFVIKGRWLDLENTIKRSSDSPQWVYYYAKNVLEDRWYEAEEILEQDLNWAYKYLIDVINKGIIA